MQLTAILGSIMLLAAAVLGAATPADKLAKRSCYNFSDPDCGVNGSYCDCPNGFYNTGPGGHCDPHGSHFYGKSESKLPGYNC